MSRDLTSRRERRRKSIGGLLPDEVIMPTGRYMVEIMDERGRKVVDMVKSNYITPLWANFAKQQQVMWPAFANRMVHNSFINAGDDTWNGAGKPFINRGLYPFWPRPFPYQCLILTDDTAPENTADHWLKGNTVGPVAWGSMWKSNNVPASGKRGQINESECTVSGDGQVTKKVWDWLTTQGNGTYQTAAIGMIGQPNTMDLILCERGPHAIVLPTSTELFAAVAAGPLGNSTNFTNISDVTISNGKVFAMVYAATGGTNFSEKRTLVADLPGGLSGTDLDGSGLLHDLSGLSWTDITPSFVNWTNTTNGGTSAHHYTWRREFCYVPADGDLLWSEIWGNGGTRFGRNDMSTKAAVWVRNWTDAAWGSRAHPGTSYQAMVQLGSFVYISCPSSTVATGSEVYRNNIYRVNYSDGLGLTLIPMPTGVTVQGGITTDGTDLFIATNRGIVKMTTAGVITKVYGAPYDWFAAVSEANLSPWPSSTSDGSQFNLFKGRAYGHLQPFGGDKNSLSLVRSQNYNNSQAIWQARMHHMGGNDNSIVDSENNRHLRFWNGRLWSCMNGDYETSLNGRYMMVGITGANCFSRALLDTPVTKSSSQTMKVSYELTFPDIDSWVHTHPTV